MTAIDPKADVQAPLGPLGRQNQLSLTLYEISGGIT
jgi:hypothetical protein